MSGQTYWSIKELAKFIFEEINPGLVFEPLKNATFIEKINDVKEAKCSSDKLIAKFGWESKVEIKEEIRKMISYAKNNSNNIKECANIPIEIPSKCPKNWI